MDSKDKDPEPTGRIVHDERGNAVWKGFAVDSTSSMLRRLEMAGLQLEGQEGVPPPAPVRASATHTPQPKKPAADLKQGYDPYDQHVAVRKPTTPKGPVTRPVPPASPMQAAKPKT
jgi:hypothetical protein